MFSDATFICDQPRKFLILCLNGESHKHVNIRRIVIDALHVANVKVFIATSFVTHSSSFASLLVDMQPCSVSTCRGVWRV